MTGEIVILDGVPHVKVGMTLIDEPIEVFRYWPLPSASGRVQGGERCYYPGDGFYLVVTHGWGALNFRLPDGGSTKATRIEEVRVPRPKTRLEVRWKSGRWEKLTKRGWVDA